MRSCQSAIGHVRDDDIVAQLSPTTLAVVFAAADGADKVRAVATRLLGELTQPCMTSFGRVRVSGNRGISLWPRDGQHAALLRWDHPHYGSSSPVEFIPLLERTGLIVEIGQWVLEKAARRLARWRNLGHEHLRLSVNVSSLQFRRCDLLALVRKAMGEQGEKLHDGRLDLELTESLFLGEHDEDQQVLGELTRAGVPLAIDDFGTGYSSFSYLINKPLDVLKIDCSFVSLLDTA